MYHVYPGTMFTQLFHYYSDLRMSNFNKNNIFWYLKSQKQRKTTYSGGNQIPDLGQAYVVAGLNRENSVHILSIGVITKPELIYS
jgi:hypothetical protein